MSTNDTFNFNLLLAKALKSDENVENIEENCCLISNETLEKNHIKLNCGHCFNYRPLYNEVITQKVKVNYLETQKIGRFSIKCPYCRYNQKGLLPIREGFKLVKYVNYPKSHVMKTKNCIYKFLSGKKKNQACGKKCHDKYCDKHKTIMDKRILKNKMKEINKDNQSHLDSFFNIPEICKKVNTHPVKSLNSFKFTHQCQHKFTKGKNKGSFCTNKMDCTGYSEDFTESYPKYYEKYYCKKHAKSKKNKNAMKEIVYPDIVLIRDTNNNNIKDKDLIDKHYSKYSNSPNYEFVVANYTCDPHYFAFKKDNDKICPQENQIISSISI